LRATQRDKAPPPCCHAPVIRADLTLVPDPAADPDNGVPVPLRPHAGRARKPVTSLNTHMFPTAAPVPVWARASGRAAQGDPLFAAGAGLALLDAHLRCDLPYAGALRSRLALKSAAASAKILRLTADEAALRDLRFAVGDPLGPAARLLRLWRDLAARPPSLDPGRILDTAARLDLAVDPDGLASRLKAGAGEGDPVSAAATAAAFIVSILPDAPAAEAEILALWAFDLVLAIRLRWARPLPLIAMKVLDPALRPPDGGPRPRPGDAAWPNAAAGAIALAAVSALDLAADLSRRADALLVVAPKLRAKPATKIVGLLLAEDCVSPAEAARQASTRSRPSPVRCPQGI